MLILIFAHKLGIDVIPFYKAKRNAIFVIITEKSLLTYVVFTFEDNQGRREGGVGASHALKKLGWRILPLIRK